MGGAVRGAAGAPVSSALDRPDDLDARRRARPGGARVRGHPDPERFRDRPRHRPRRADAAARLFVLVGGVWADRLPRQMVMLVSDVVRGAVQAAIAVLLLSAARRSSGTSSSSSRSTGPRRRSSSLPPPGSCPRRSAPQRLQQANALLGLSRSIAFVVGPGDRRRDRGGCEPGQRLRRGRRDVRGQRDRRSHSCGCRAHVAAGNARASSPTSRAAGTSSSRTRGCG